MFDSFLLPARLRRHGLALALSTLVCLWPGCREDHPVGLAALSARLAPEAIRALEAGDDPTLRRCLRAAGQTTSTQAFWELSLGLPLTSVDEFTAAEARVDGAADRLAAAVDAEFEHSQLSLRRAAYRRRPPEQRMEILRIMRGVFSLSRETGAPIPQQEHLLRELLEESRSFDDAVDRGDLYGSYANLLPRLNRQDEMPYYLRVGIQTAIENDYTATACQLLGTLGVIHQTSGDEVAMRACWDQALELARRTNGWQEARILSFYAAYYRSRGQFAVARDLLLQAQDRCRELQAKEVELRFLYDSLQLFGSLGCWDVVGRGLQRAQVLARQGQSAWSPFEADLWAGRLQQVRARYLAATGACAPAESLALALVQRIGRWQPAPPREECMLDAARALLACGQAQEAQRLLDRGIEQCHAYGMPELLEEYSLEAAQAYLELGDFDRCQQALDSFRSHAGTNPSEDVVRNWIRHDGLAVRVALHAQGHAAAVERLEIALERLATQQRQLGAGPEAYLALAAADELRELGHQLLDQGPGDGYALEMAWRRFRAYPQRPVPPPGALSVASLAASARDALSPAALPADYPLRLHDRHAVHCIYDVRDSSVVRWTASAEGITRDTLVASRQQLEQLVARVRGQFDQQVDASPPLDLQALRDLHQLAAWLLPDSILHAHSPVLVLITADGFLGRLPFELLNLAPESFTPLLSSHDVAYLRSWRGAAPTREGAAIVVSRPAYPTGLRRRYSVLNEALPLGAAEAELFRRLLPLSVLLDGAAATKQNLRDRWQQARFLYFACHVVQDPEVPYIAFVPMAAAASGRDEESYLELADILNADLSGCELVVLSSCASGVPYVDGRVASPSLADAFVDAGARAVISTFWNVRDDAAARAMREFARAYQAIGADPVAALCNARRRLLREGADAHDWAAYGITLGGL